MSCPPRLDLAQPFLIENRPHLPLFHEGREIMSAAMQELLAILDLEQAGAQSVSRSQPQGRLAARLRRPDHRPGAGRRAAHRRAGPPRPFAARLFHAPRRHQGADRLRGRPHPRRRLLHHAARGGDPARPGDLLAGSFVPGRRGRAGAPGADAARRARSRDAARPARTDRTNSATPCPMASGATGSATGRSR